MRVSWEGVTFERPDSFVDTSVLSFVDDAAMPGVSLTVSQQALKGGKPALLAYVAEQQAALKSSVPGYAVVSEKERAMGAGPALAVDAHVPSAKRVIHQLYVLDEARARVLVATVTAQQAKAQDARALTDRISATLTIGGAA